jgi:hypothetical protein
MTVRDLRELVSRMSFVAPSTGEGVGVDRRKVSVRVDGKTVCSSSHEFARMLQYMRIVLQKFVECAQSDAQSSQTSQSLKQIKQVSACGIPQPRWCKHCLQSPVACGMPTITF